MATWRKCCNYIQKEILGIFPSGGSEPPPPGCCADLKDMYPSFGYIQVARDENRYQTNPYNIPGIDCPVVLTFTAFSVTPNDGSVINILINGSSFNLPINFPTQFTLNSGDEIIFENEHTINYCTTQFINCYNETCQVDYGAIYTLQFGDPACDFCPLPWDLTPLETSSTSYATPGYIFRPNTIQVALNPWLTYQNTTNQNIDLFINPVITSTNINGDLYLYKNGGQFLPLILSGAIIPSVYTMVPGDVIGFNINSPGPFCFSVDIYLNNETCDIFLGVLSLTVISNNCP